MKFVPVASSNLESVGYDPDTKTLAVKFKGSDHHYEYSGVEPHHHDNLRAAQSPGGYLNGQIKGRYPHKKVEAK
jgi:hypothetical protein